MSNIQDNNFETIQPLGDVHSAESFGYDLNNPDDVKKWVEITGEVAVTYVHPAHEPRSGVDPNDDDYFSQLAETRGD